MKYVPPDGLWEHELEWKPEHYLHDYFYRTVKDDFYTAHEVEGFCFLPHESYKNQRIIADFMLYPRPHLVELGFAETWFAVEIKTFMTRFGKAAKQAFGYNFSKFKIKNREVVPAFSTVWIPRRFTYSCPSMPDDGASRDEWLQYIRDTDNQSFLNGEKHSWIYLNVGSMNLNRHHIKWEIKFADSYAGQGLENGFLRESAHVNKSRKRFTARIGSGNVIDIASGLGKQA